MNLNPEVPTCSKPRSWSSIHVTLDEDPIELVYKADELLNTLLRKTLINEGRPVLLLLSGGSDLSLLRCLDCIHADSFSSALTVSVLDERFSRSPDENNFLQITNSSFFVQAEEKNVRFIRTVPEERESLKDFAQRIEQEYRDWYEVNRDGVIIITQGIGSDGHTAGMNVTLSPEEFSELFEGHEWVIGYTSKKLYPPKRITMTTYFLKEMVNTSIIYAVGENKKWALTELFKEEFKDELFTLPIRIVHQMRNVHLFTDVEVV